MLELSAARVAYEGHVNCMLLTACNPVFHDAALHCPQPMRFSYCVYLCTREKGHSEAVTTHEYALSWYKALKVVLRRQWTLTLRDRGLIIGR